MIQDNIYQNPMHPWPVLKPFGQRISLSSVDLELFYFEAGQENKQTIIMIHGLGDEADTWRNIFLPLSQNFHVIALDLPGFGRSQKQNLAFTPGILVESLLGLINELNVARPILMGSSLGAMLAHHIALVNPRLLRALILVGGALNQNEMGSNLSMRLMQIPLLGEWLYTRLRKDPQAAFESLNSVYHDLKNLPSEDQDFLFTRVNKRVWDDGQKDAYLSLLRKLPGWVRGLQGQIAKKSATLEIPALVVRGEFDTLFSPENGLALVEGLPNAQMMKIKGAGHLPHQEKPAEFLFKVEKWLAQKFLTSHK
jgi:pimeloyl-ACP methyl ester carboxylesterase